MNEDDVRDLTKLVDSRKLSIKDLVMGNISEAELSKILECLKEGG